jgi:hypothetical protein
MRFLIIDQCSGNKDVPDTAPEFETDEIDAYSRDALLTRDDVPAIPARQLYTGRQQRFINSAVNRLRAGGDTVDRMYISAGFGLVDESTELPPYEVTFSDMSAAGIDERATQLGIPSAVRDAIDTDPPYDIVILALGSDYYRACDLERVLAALPNDTIGVVFNQEAVAADRESVISISARTAEAAEHGTIVVALKGKYIEYLSQYRAEGASIENQSDIVEYLTTEPTTQTGFDDYS